MNNQPSPKWTLLALAISAFAIGSTEFISVGLLPLIKEHFNTTLPLAGLTVSLYAFGVTVGAPILTAFTSRLGRKNILLLVMLIFIVGNLLAALSPTFALLLIGRIVSALAHGVFMSVASIIAAEVVAPNKRASAIAIMFSGLTIATVTGVPLGTFIGQVTSWRMSFIFIAFIGLIGLVCNRLLIPKKLSKSAPVHLHDLFTVLKNGRMVLILLITAIGYGGTFVIYTFLSPILETKLGFQPGTIIFILVVYGLFVAIGNTIGGRLSNAQPLRSLFFMFAALAIILFTIHFTMTMQVLGLIVLLLMGLFMFMNVPGLQLYAVQLAEIHMPKATVMASALNIAAFNIGIAAGSYIGGIVVKYDSLETTPLVASFLVTLATIITGAWLIFDNKKNKQLVSNKS